MKTNLKLKEVIFDSDYCNWSVGNCDFNERVFNHDKLLFLIETNKNVKVGGFLFEKIDEMGNLIMDPKSFLFNYSNNKFQTFDISKVGSSYIFAARPSHDYHVLAADWCSRVIWMTTSHLVSLPPCSSLQTLFLF